MKKQRALPHLIERPAAAGLRPLTGEQIAKIAPRVQKEVVAAKARWRGDPAERAGRSRPHELG